jgi:hypothetical protein
LGGYLAVALDLALGLGVVAAIIKNVGDHAPEAELIERIGDSVVNTPKIQATYLGKRLVVSGLP